jgi:hypothetical protein
MAAATARTNCAARRTSFRYSVHLFAQFVIAETDRCSVGAVRAVLLAGVVLVRRRVAAAGIVKPGGDFQLTFQPPTQVREAAGQFLQVRRVTLASPPAALAADQIERRIVIRRQGRNQRQVVFRCPRLGRPAAELLVGQQRSPQLTGRPTRMVCQQGFDTGRFARPRP